MHLLSTRNDAYRTRSSVTCVTGGTDLSKAKMLIVDRQWRFFIFTTLQINGCSGMRERMDGLMLMQKKEAKLTGCSEIN